MDNLIASFLKIFFRLLYNQFAWSYDFVANLVSLGMWYQWVTSAIALLECGPVLELGFGTGRLLRELSCRGIAAIGVDRSMYMARLAMNNLLTCAVEPKLVNGFAPNLPFRSESFPRIAATFPSEYIMERQTILELWRVLSPGGRVVIIPTAWITGESLFHRLAAKLFQITHQSPSEQLIEVTIAHFSNTWRAEGFVVQGSIIDLPKSKVMCIVAEKPQS